MDLFLKLLNHLIAVGLRLDKNTLHIKLSFWEYEDIISI